LSRFESASTVGRSLLGAAADGPEQRAGSGGRHGSRIRKHG
jgi:hypothetical protein